MRTMRLFWLELRRLLQSRLTWLIVLLTVLSPLVGQTLYRPATASTMLTQYLANPAIAGGAVGGVLFGILTIFELDRPSRSRVEALTDAAVSPLTMALVRLAALITSAVLALLLVMAVWFPISWGMIGQVFDAADYLLSYLLLTGLALPLGILAAGAAYQFTRRLDLSLVLLAGFAALSLTVWADDWQLCWLNPCVWALSDDFSNFRIFRSVAYMRLSWLLALAGVWAVSYLCIRQYGKGMLGSLRHSARRLYRPLAAALLLGCSLAGYAGHPLVGHSNPVQAVMTLLEIPYLEQVLCTGRTAQVFPDTRSGTVEGKATYQLENRSGKAQTVAFGINPGYEVSDVRANGEETAFTVSDYQEYNEALLEVEIPAEQQIELSLSYGGFPQEDVNMSTMQGDAEVSDEYLCLQNSALAPRILNVLPDENLYPATIEVTLPQGMTVIPFSSAQPELVAEQENNTVTWRYQDNGAGGILYAGDYVREEIKATGLTVEFYYGRKHQQVMEQAGAVEAVQAVVDYCTEHYGALSFGAGGSLKLIQSRTSGGGYAADGASLLDEQDFTAANLGDSSKGAAAGEVMIHELVHQWWGLGNMFDTAEEDSPWSAEGLTVYTTYRIVKALYGEEYAREHYIDQWQQAVDDYYLNFYVRNPAYLQMLPEEERLQISNSLRYVRQYCEMPLKILKAEQLVGGEQAMDTILNSLFNRELDPMYPYLSYQDFLDACGLKEEDLNLA